MKLRPYQIEAFNGACKTLTTSRSALLVLPTGTGKTVIFTSMAQLASKRVMILAHREELIMQAKEKLEALGLHVGVEMASYYSDEHGFHTPDVVVSSVQTLSKPRRMRRFKPNDFSLLIIDEAHHAPAKSYLAVTEFFHNNPDLKLLGVTATPDRADKLALGRVFDEVAYTYEIQDAISDGWLVPVRQQVVTVADLDFSKITTTAGDLNQKQLADVMENERALHEVAAPSMDLIGDRKAIVFASSVAHAQRLAEIFNRSTPGSAACIDGKTPKDVRNQLLERFQCGDFNILVNVGVFTEGFDEPDIRVVVLARPTKSRALYAQMVGRGTRPLHGLVDAHGSARDRKDAIASSDKPRVEVLDFAGNAGRHKLVTAVDILGGKYPEAVQERARTLIEKSEGKVDVGDALDSAQNLIEMEKRRELDERKRRGITARAEFATSDVDPFGVTGKLPPHQDQMLKRHEVYGYRSATSKQVEFLRKWGIDRADELTHEQASKLIGELIQRKQSGLCTAKQARFLQRRGYTQQDTATMSFGEASDLIGDIIARRTA